MQEEAGRNTISAERARTAVRRLINSHFGNQDQAQASIPANREWDDDLVATDYIDQTEQRIASLEAALREKEQCVDELEQEVSHWKNEANAFQQTATWELNELKEERSKYNELWVSRDDICNNLRIAEQRVKELESELAQARAEIERLTVSLAGISAVSFGCGMESARECVEKREWAFTQPLKDVLELREKYDSLRADLARLSAPVSDAEWKKHVGVQPAMDRDGEINIHESSTQRLQVNAILAARAKQETKP